MFAGELGAEFVFDLSARKKSAMELVLGRETGRRGGWEGGRTDGDFEIHHLLRERAHLVVETEPVFPRICGGEHEIALSLLLVFHDYLFVRAHHAVVDVEGAAGLYLQAELKVSDRTYGCLAPI